MSDTKTPSSFDSVEHDATLAAEEKKDADDVVGVAGQRAPAAGHEVGGMQHPSAMMHTFFGEPNSASPVQLSPFSTANPEYCLPLT